MRSGGGLPRPHFGDADYGVAYMMGYGKDPYADQLKIGPTLVPANRWSRPKRVGTTHICAAASLLSACHAAA